jgi:peptide/nickel transport system permease protein
MGSTATPIDAPRGQAIDAEERIFVASQWTLMWLHFKRHKLAVGGSIAVIILYAMAIFHGFLAPYEKATRSQYLFLAPTKLVFNDGDGFSLRPYVYQATFKSDPKTFSRVAAYDTATRYPVEFLSRVTSTASLAFSAPRCTFLAWNPGPASFCWALTNSGVTSLAACSMAPRSRSPLAWWV